MSNRHSQNENLDRIGRRLLQTAKVKGEELDRIVASPQLFEAVKARIKAEKQSRRTPQRFFDGWINLSFPNRQTIAGAMAILLVTAVCAAVIIFKKQETPQIVERTFDPETKLPITPSERREQLAEIKETEIVAVKNPTKVERVVHKVKKLKSSYRKLKPDQSKAPQSYEKQSPEVFYSLAIGGNWDADGEDLQVVRAELSRSELFALGVNLPDQEEIAKVKTDLLVGANGVPRAIRFVE